MTVLVHNKDSSMQRHLPILTIKQKSQYIGIMTQREMKQKYAVVILLALICASGLTSFKSYRATERMVAEDIAQV